MHFATQCKNREFYSHKKIRENRYQIPINKIICIELGKFVDFTKFFQKNGESKFLNFPHCVSVSEVVVKPTFLCISVINCSKKVRQVIYHWHSVEKNPCKNKKILKKYIIEIKLISRNIFKIF